MTVLSSCATIPRTVSPNKRSDGYFSGRAFFLLSIHLMPRVTIKFGQPLSQTIGQRRITLDMPEGSTAADLLDELTQRYPGFRVAFRGDDLGRSSPYIFFLNSRPVTPPHFATTRLQEGDVVHLVLPVVGGAHG